MRIIALFILILFGATITLPPTACDPNHLVYPCLYRTQPGENLEMIASRNNIGYHAGHWLCKSNNLQDEWWGLSEQERDDIKARLQAIDPAFKPGPCSYFQRGGFIRIEPQPEGWESWHNIP